MDGVNYLWTRCRADLLLPRPWRFIVRGAQMGAAMPGPADERIKRFLKQRHDVQLAAEQQNQLDEEREQERKRKTELIKAKWIADAHIIAEILTDLGEKLFDAGLSLVFQDTGPSDPEIVASGLISGQFVGKPIELVLKVKSDGAIDVGEAASRVQL